MHERLIESGIHHERHKFRVRFARPDNHARVHAAGDYAIAVERKNLRADNRNLVGMRKKTLTALFAACRVPQRVELLMR